MKKRLTPVYAIDEATGGGTASEEQTTDYKEKESVKEDETESVNEQAKRDFEVEKKKLANENEQLRKELGKIKKEHLSAEEIKRDEIEELTRNLAEREAAVKDSENRLYAVKAIKAAGLDDGGDKALALVDFVMADDTETIDKRIKSFDSLVKRYIKDEVEKTFKSSGRNPRAANAGEGEPEKKGGLSAKIGRMNAETKKISEDIIKHYIGN